jgi:hypothetical protein
VKITTRGLITVLHGMGFGAFIIEADWVPFGKADAWMAF